MAREATTMTTPLLSIGLPVYNRAKLLRASVDSLLDQSFKDFDLIITDNASTDETETVCREYAQRDRRIRYYRNPSNIGAPCNFNRTFELSRTKYFKWATSDDLCGPQFLELAIDVLERDPAVVLCYAKTMIIAEDGSPIGEYEDKLHLTESIASPRFTRLLNTIGLCHQHQGVIRSAALGQTALLQDHIGSDVNLLAELSLYGRFYELPQRLFFRRMHPDASSWARTDLARQAEFYDPGKSRGIVLHGLRQHLAYLGAVHRAPISSREKVVLYRFILRRMIQDRDRLRSELGRLAGMLVGHVAGRRRDRGGAGSPS